MVSAGTDGVELGFRELWDCLTTMEFDITGLLKCCQIDRFHILSDEVDRESVVRAICILRLTRRGLETGFVCRASPRPYL